MLSLLYIAIVALPLTLAAIAFLVIALRAGERRVQERRESRLADEQAGPGGPRSRAAVHERTTLATPPDPDADSLQRLRQAGLRSALRSALDPDTQTPARRVVDQRPGSPSTIREVADLSGAASPEPLPAGVPTKDCPDCAETVLEAARICKHCRYRFDGAGAEVVDGLGKIRRAI